MRTTGRFGRAMSGNETNADNRITLASKLSEIARIPPWLKNLASRDRIPERTRFGMDLCLEEVLSNIIRHGYGGAPNHTILVIYGNPQSDTFTLVVEDEAPLFNPLSVRDKATHRSHEEISQGGRGIQLLRQFADKVDYEPTLVGNRLTVSFVVPELTGPALGARPFDG